MIIVVRTHLQFHLPFTHFFVDDDDDSGFIFSTSTQLQYKNLRRNTRRVVRTAQSTDSEIPQQQMPSNSKLYATNCGRKSIQSTERMLSKELQRRWRWQWQQKRARTNTHTHTMGNGSGNPMSSRSCCTSLCIQHPRPTPEVLSRNKSTHLNWNYLLSCITERMERERERDSASERERVRDRAKESVLNY